LKLTADTDVKHRAASLSVYVCYVQAVAVTFVKFFLEPAGHIGEALNRLVTAAFDDLPFYLWLPVFILIVLLIVLAMFFMSGYRVRGWLWNIEPHRPVEPLRERIQLLEQERQALQDERRDLQRQLAVEQHERTEQRVRLGELQVGCLQLTCCNNNSSSSKNNNNFAVVLYMSLVMSRTASCR